MIHLDRVTVAAGARPVGPATLTVPAGGYAVLIGPTGGGKTSLLEAAAGLRPALAGRVVLAGRDVTRLAPAARGIGYVPQDVALFGRLTVADNIGFALAVRGDLPAAIRTRVYELADELGVAHLLARFAADLSGGEAQRVALARAAAHRPPVLLLDEPFAALDAAARGRVAAAVARWHAAGGVTVLHVTHHPAEAAAVATLTLDLAGVVRG